MGNDPELGKLRRALHGLDAKLLQLLRQRLGLASPGALTEKELESRPRLSGLSKKRPYSKPSLFAGNRFARGSPGSCSVLEGISAEVI